MSKFSHDAIDDDARAMTIPRRFLHAIILKRIHCTYSPDFSFYLLSSSWVGIQFCRSKISLTTVLKITFNYPRLDWQAAVQKDLAFYIREAVCL